MQTDLFGNNIVAVQQGPLAPPSGQGPAAMDFASDFTLYSVELQQSWETPFHTLVIGGRWQSGNLDTHATLTDLFLTEPNPVIDESVNGSLERGNANLTVPGRWRTRSCSSRV